MDVNSEAADQTFRAITEPRTPLMTKSPLGFPPTLAQDCLKQTLEVMELHTISLANAVDDYLIVTSSSALDGWIATQLSKSCLVAPIFTATPKPWRISLLARPRM